MASIRDYGLIVLLASVLRELRIDSPYRATDSADTKH